MANGDGPVEELARRTDAKLPQAVYLCDSRHDECMLLEPPAQQGSGVVSKWRMKNQMRTGCVALVLCLNIGIDPPDVIKVSPCARTECWIDPLSMDPEKAIDAIGKALQAQYERWQRKARYKVQLDATVEEVKRLCAQCRKSTKSERVLFHYNGHGVPRPTASGEIWFFNQNYTQYIPLSIYDLDSWMGVPSIYVFDCSGAGAVVKALCERPDLSTKDCIMLAACAGTEALPLSRDFPADVFTACLTTPIKIALRWFWSRSLLRDSLTMDDIDKIPGVQNERRTPLGELNWIFTAITDTIAWNVLPRELFQRLFRQDLLVASLFRNFLLAERIMRSANCTPQSFPKLPHTYQHHMWDAWDLAAELCLSQLPALLNDPNAEFQPNSFFTEQLTAFEIWLDLCSETKSPPEQLPIVLQALLSQSQRFRALLLLGRFLDMGSWAIDQVLSVGIFPYVLKLLQSTATELRQVLVFIWTKILALDKSCQVDLVKEGGHLYFIKFLHGSDSFAEQQAMAAFVLAVVVDGYPRGQAACHEAGLLGVCLRHIASVEVQSEPLFLQWLCLCLGKLWDGMVPAQLLAYREKAVHLLAQLLSAPQPEVRASAVFALGTLINAPRNEASVERSAVDDDEEADRLAAEQDIAKVLLKAVIYQADGSPLVRAELAVALARFAANHKGLLQAAASTYLKPPSNPPLPSFAGSVCPSQVLLAVRSFAVEQGKGQPDFAAEQDKQVTSTSSSAASSAPSSGPSSPLDGFKVLESGSSRPRRYRADDNSSLYLRCIAAAYSLARDTSPKVAEFGQQILRIIGIGSTLIGKSFAKPGHHRNSSVPSIHLGASGGLTRSTSWVETNLASLVTPLRSSASPPSRPSFLGGSSIGMRRVPSLEFSPSLIAPRESSRLASRTDASSGGIPKHSPAGLAEAGTMFATSAPDFELPSSSLYAWSCGRFAKPLLEPAQEDDRALLVLREIREKMAYDGIAKCQHSNVMRLADPIWEAQSNLAMKAVLLHPFDTFICAVDERETIRVWNYGGKDDGEDNVVNTFDNHNFPERGVSKACLVNELEEALLLVASSDGSVRLWRNFMQKGEQRCATSWQSLQSHRSGGRALNAVVEWQQSTGFLYAAGELPWYGPGEIPPIMVWDLDVELLASSIPTRSESIISAMSASQGPVDLMAAGYADGSVRVYDVRTQDMMVCSMRPHSHKVVGLDFQPGTSLEKLVSASQGGDIKFLDLRNPTLPSSGLDAHKGHLTAFSVQRHAEVMATGSAGRCIKVFNMVGQELAKIRFHNSFLAHKIGPVSCLSFHPYKVLLGAGATDSTITIYGGESTEH